MSFANFPLRAALLVHAGGCLGVWACVFVRGMCVYKCTVFQFELSDAHCCARMRVSRVWRPTSAVLTIFPVFCYHYVRKHCGICSNEYHSCRPLGSMRASATGKCRSASVLEHLVALGVVIPACTHMPIHGAVCALRVRVAVSAAAPAIPSSSSGGGGSTRALTDTRARREVRLQLGHVRQLARAPVAPEVPPQALIGGVLLDIQLPEGLQLVHDPLLRHADEHARPPSLARSTTQRTEAVMKNSVVKLL